MTIKVTMGQMPWAAGTREIPAARGPLYPHHGELFGLQRLSTDSIGVTTLTLTNVVVGSRYRIERAADGSLATPTGNAEGVAGASTVAITLDYYSAGNANNDLRIKVRKGTSAPKYLPFETQATIGAAAQSVYVAQVADPIA